MGADSEEFPTVRSVLVLEYVSASRGRTPKHNQTTQLPVFASTRTPEYVVAEKISNIFCMNHAVPRDNTRLNWTNSRDMNSWVHDLRGNRTSRMRTFSPWTNRTSLSGGDEGLMLPGPLSEVSPFELVVNRVDRCPGRLYLGSGDGDGGSSEGGKERVEGTGFAHRLFSVFFASRYRARTEYRQNSFCMSYRRCRGTSAWAECAIILGR